MTVTWQPMFSEYSVFTAFLFFVSFTVLCYFVSKYAGWRMLWVMGVGVIFTIARCTLPIELPGTRNIYLSSFFSKLFHLSRMPIWRTISPLQIFLTFWVIGALFFLIRVASRIMCNIYAPLEEDSTPSRRMNELYEKMLQELGCEKRGTLLMSSSISVARSAGFFYPNVILPIASENMPDEKVCYTLKHEILHYLHHDVWINLAAEILSCLFWWNPAVYLLQYTVTNLLELRCDSHVCKDLSDEQMLDYSQMLLDAFQTSPEQKDPLFSGLLGGLKRKARSHDVKRRFQQICNAVEKRPQQKWVSAVAFIISCALFMGSYTVTFQTDELPPENEIGTAVMEQEDDSNYIMRRPDGTLELFIGHQTYGTLSPERLKEEPYSSMLIVDVYRER